jgi:hypothetical protein
MAQFPTSMPMSLAPVSSAATGGSSGLSSAAFLRSWSAFCCSPMRRVGQRVAAPGEHLLVAPFVVEQFGDAVGEQSLEHGGRRLLALGQLLAQRQRLVRLAAEVVEDRQVVRDSNVVDALDRRPHDLGARVRAALRQGALSRLERAREHGQLVRNQRVALASEGGHVRAEVPRDQVFLERALVQVEAPARARELGVERGVLWVRRQRGARGAQARSALDDRLGALEQIHRRDEARDPVGLEPGCVADQDGRRGGDLVALGSRAVGVGVDVDRDEVRLEPHLGDRARPGGAGHAVAVGGFGGVEVE